MISLIPLIPPLPAEQDPGCSGADDDTERPDQEDEEDGEEGACETAGHCYEDVHFGHALRGGLWRRTADGGSGEERRHDGGRGDLRAEVRICYGSGSGFFVDDCTYKALSCCYFCCHVIFGTMKRGREQEDRCCHFFLSPLCGGTWIVRLCRRTA